MIRLSGWSKSTAKVVWIVGGAIVFLVGASFLFGVALLLEGAIQ